MSFFKGTMERYDHKLGRCVAVETESSVEEASAVEVESQDVSNIDVPISASNVEMIYAPERVALAETDGRRIYYGDSFLECSPAEQGAWVAHELHHIANPNADEFECNVVRDAALKQNGGWEKFSARYNLSGEWNQ